MKKRDVRFIYFGLLPMLTIAGAILPAAFIPEQQECNGLVEALGFAAAFLVVILVFAVTCFIQVVRMFDQPNLVHRLIMLACCAALGYLSLFLLSRPPGYLKADVLLQAEMRGDYPCTLVLRSDGTYSATETALDWACTYHGNYTISEDSVFLEDVVVDLSNGLFSNTYVKIGDSLLLPVAISTGHEVWPLAITSNKLF